MNASRQTLKTSIQQIENKIKGRLPNNHSVGRCHSTSNVQLAAPRVNVGAFSCFAWHGVDQEDVRVPLNHFQRLTSIEWFHLCSEILFGLCIILMQCERYHAQQFQTGFPLRAYLRYEVVCWLLLALFSLEAPLCFYLNTWP